MKQTVDFHPVQADYPRPDGFQALTQSSNLAIISYSFECDSRLFQKLVNRVDTSNVTLRAHGAAKEKLLAGVGRPLTESNLINLRGPPPHDAITCHSSPACPSLAPFTRTHHPSAELCSQSFTALHLTPRPTAISLNIPYQSPFQSTVSIMKLLNVVVALSGAVCATESPSLFSNPADVSRIPSSYESAVMGRRILALTKLATLSTVFPDEHSSEVDTLERRPAGLGGVPIGLMDYVADCEEAGNPTILAINIATSFKNVRAGSNITLSMRWTPPYPPSNRMSFLSRLAAYVPFFSESSPYFRSSELLTPPDTVPYSAANLPRFSLLGYLESIEPNPVESVRLAACFTRTHQDAKYWLPGNAIHTSEWARLVVTQVYWIGGFGDRAYIGWIPVDEWKNVTKGEWQDIQLPGEKKGWNEWHIDEAVEL